MRSICVLLSALALLRQVLGSDIDPRDFTVELSAQGQAPRLTLNWSFDPSAASYRVSRKVLGTTAWSQLAELPGSATGFADNNVPLGSAYEYEVEERTTYGTSAYGYLYGGNANGLSTSRGKVILIVERSVAPALSFELSQLEQDLIGDGWVVIRHDVGRSDSVGSVRDLIRSDYYADPSNVKSVFLLGHVPVPYSGDINPDMHPGHKGAWPADVFYADIDGNWSDSIVWDTDAEDPRNANVPGDGKYDQSMIPSTVELELGRVDLYDMPSFLPKTETDLLRQYLQKDHRYRHKQLTAVPRALVHDNFGEIDGDAPAIDAWRNFPAFFGVENVRAIGPNQFFDVLAGDSYLWAYGAGGGAYDKADGVGSTLDFARRDPKTIFTILHGSYFGDWDFTDNFSRAPLATESYGLACIWAGLPHWFLHPMALGESLGYVTRLNQNNTGLYKSQVNLSAGQVHISLMGDPTLRMHVVAPPSGLSAQLGGGVVLNWSGAPDSVLGYNVYRAENPNGPFTRLNRSYIVGSTYTDTAAISGQQWYMVRAVKMESTASGSYINASQGIFATINVNGGPSLPIVTLAVIDGQAREADGHPALFSIRRTGSTAAPLSVLLNVTGSAVNGADYPTINNVVVIPAGQSETTLSIQPAADGIEEGTETIVIAIGSTAAYQVGNPNLGQALLLDTPVNHPPSISVIADQTINQDAAAGPIAFTIADLETAPANLSLSASSSNPALLPVANISLGGSGASRSVTLRPAPGQFGGVDVTISASDGQLSATRTFHLTVNAVNLPPPRITDVLRISDGSTEIRFAGRPGKSWTVEQSADLTAWTQVGQGTAQDDSTIVFRDPAGSSVKRRYYRLSWR